MKLRGKVNLALIAAFAVGHILAGGGAYKVLTDEAVDKKQWWSATPRGANI
jgi:hypothetical protein